MEQQSRVGCRLFICFHRLSTSTHLKCSAVEFGGVKQSILSPLWISKERKGKCNASLFPCSDISNSHMFVLKMIRIFFPLSKHLLLKSSNPLYSLVLHSAALLLLCVDKSLWVHASLICPTGEDVDGLAGRCRCLLLSSDIAPLRTPHGVTVCAAVLWLAFFKHVSKFCRVACSL